MFVAESEDDEETTQKRTRIKSEPITAANTQKCNDLSNRYSLLALINEEEEEDEDEEYDLEEEDGEVKEQEFKLANPK